MTTEGELGSWRYGQVQAERLCAGILSIEGYSAVDPQHPLGGPDGIKDVVCRRGITKFVAAVYFPTTPVTFGKVKKKFLDDLKGVKANNAKGFAFFFGQALTITQRAKLQSLCEPEAIQVELFHAERLRAVLDSPQGCGLRLEYLRIPMTLEEQIAYWSSANVDIASQLKRIEMLQQRTLHTIESSTAKVISRTTSAIENLTNSPSSWMQATTPHISTSGSPATSAIDIPGLCWLHRLVVMPGSMPESLRGTLRTMMVTIQSADGSTGVFTPPPPEELPGLLDHWCTSWRENYATVESANEADKMEAIVKSYYAFLAIHPFTDGNGRVARAILDQLVRELLAQVISSSFLGSPVEHQEALQQAAKGNFAPLRQFLRASII